MSQQRPPLRLSVTDWLVLAIASIGFLFDSYQLLMTPLVGVPAIAEILGLPPTHPTVTGWMGPISWISAACGGVFGLLGGWFIDRFGRKRIMIASILLYSVSPAAAALATTVPAFIFFRCLTFIGVCVEFVAAVTWLAELFPDKRQKEIALGVTQAFASLGGLFVTSINFWIDSLAPHLTALPISEAFNQHAPWRYLCLTGFLPMIPIALLLPFVPESKVWRERRAAGTLRRPSFGELFSPQYRRVTIVSTILSACAYGAAFGALQLNTRQISPGLPELAATQKSLKPIADEAKNLNSKLSEVMPAFNKALEDVPDLRELAAKRARTRIAQRAAKKADNKEQLAALAATFKGYDGELDNLTASNPDAKKSVLAREKALKDLADNRDKQEPYAPLVRHRGEQVQFVQELGGLIGRIVLALLLLTALSRGNLLRLFLVPGIVLFAVTYGWLYHTGGAIFSAGVFLCGFCVVAQFSYFGEYLPKVFPVHLRGTGASFATNVGGRMIGTSAAFFATNILAPMLKARPGADQFATAACIIGVSVFVAAFVVSFLLPEPKEENSIAETVQDSAARPPAPSPA